MGCVRNSSLGGKQEDFQGSSQDSILEERGIEVGHGFSLHDCECMDETAGCEKIER